MVVLADVLLCDGLVEAVMFVSVRSWRGTGAWVVTFLLDSRALEVDAARNEHEYQRRDSPRNKSVFRLGIRSRGEEEVAALTPVRRADSKMLDISKRSLRRDSGKGCFDYSG